MKNLITELQNLPNPGDTGYDLLQIFNNPIGFKGLIDRLYSIIELTGIDIDKVVGVEPGGLLIAPALAYKIEAGFVPIIQSSNLLSVFHKTMGFSIPIDSIKPYEHVLIVDDVIRTGETVKQACEMVENMHGHVVGCMAVIEIVESGGVDILKELGYPVYTIYQFNKED